MSDFDKSTFEQLMGDAVQLHVQQQYEAALSLSMQAYQMAPDNSFEKGRAARDNSARYDRLGQLDKAEVWANEAYEVHDGLVKSMEHPSREAFRERSVSAMYVGVSGLRKVIHARQDNHELDGSQALGAMRQTWSDLHAAKMQAQGINRKVDQYEINAARRVSIAENLFGSSKKGLAIGTRAVALAFMSESPQLDTSTPNLIPKQRMQTKFKAFLGGMAAVGVGVLSAPKNSTTQRLARSLANKTL